MSKKIVNINQNSHRMLIYAGYSLFYMIGEYLTINSQNDNISFDSSTKFIPTVCAVFIFCTIAEVQFRINEIE